MSGLISNLKSLIGDTSNVQFARKVGLSEAVIRKILSGGSPNLVTLNKIARACNVRMSWLVGNSTLDTTNNSEVLGFEYESEPVKPLLTTSVEHKGYVANQKTPTYPAMNNTVSNAVLSKCFNACAVVYGQPFNILTVVDQLAYTTKLYNQINMMYKALDADLIILQKLDDTDYVMQLNLLIKLTLMPADSLNDINLYSF